MLIHQAFIYQNGVIRWSQRAHPVWHELVLLSYPRMPCHRSLCVMAKDSDTAQIPLSCPQLTRISWPFLCSVHPFPDSWPALAPTDAYHFRGSNAITGSVPRHSIMLATSRPSAILPGHSAAIDSTVPLRPSSTVQ